MGPRSDDRGNEIVVVAPAFGQQASMGPRSDDRGNKDLMTERAHHLTASMGPRSDDRGNPLKWMPWTLPWWLQWGRDQMIAEMYRLHEYRCGDYLLQWGRDQMIAEIPSGARSLLAPGYASMGPRSDDRGNTPQGRCLRSGDGRLQWGRAQMIAEMNALACWPSAAFLASMGPRSDDRGNGWPTPMAGSPATGFNGAAIR